MVDFTITTQITASQILAANDTGIISASGGVTTQSTAITITGNGATLINSGTISSADMAVYGASYDGFTLNNSGTIIGNRNLIRLSESMTNSIGTNSFVNSGLISATDPSYAVCIQSEAKFNTFVNSGTLISAGSGVSFSGEGAGYNKFINSGVITADGYAIYSDGHGASFENTGKITGSVALLGGNATVQNAGDVFGQLYTGGFNDNIDNQGRILGGLTVGDGTNYIVNSGLIGGSVFGGDGETDQLNNYGSISGYVNLKDGANYLTNYGKIDGSYYGGADSDSVSTEFGTMGAVVLGAGSDGFVGNNFTNYVGGDDGNDYLSTNGGNDQLYGGDDKDTLYGGSGSDMLGGGTGKDSIFGGTGADVFSFFGTTDSANSNQADVIGDFRHGQDHIDLRYVFAGTLKFMGKAAFADNGIESVRYVVNGTIARVLVDANGDGVADMKILLSGVKTLTTGDFIL